MIKAIDHIGIMTNDLQKSVGFYTDVLGFSVFQEVRHGRSGIISSFRSIEIEMGGSLILINDRITFSVDDIEATVADIKEKGVAFNLEQIQLESGMKLAFFNDPDGVLIEPVEHPH